uniref:phosphotransferase enzyme family protein n=1 Tax=Algoriphagus sp. TaxID=1872435 RepID=UPI004048E252
MFDVLSTALKQAYPQFTTAPLKISPFGEGLIHETLLLQQGDTKWVLQGFNTTVFRHPERIAHNLNLLSKHLSQYPLPFQLPLPLVTRESKGLASIEGKQYRLFDFVQGTTLQQVQQPVQAKIAAHAYGKFAAWASLLPVASFEDTIPHFHRLDMRFTRLMEVVKGRTHLPKEEQSLLEGYLAQKPLVDYYLKQLAQLPLRVMHNDTKINNLIFAPTLEKVEALVDLDTLMGGYLMYDFGDLVRTVACSLPETATEWTQIHVLPKLFEELLLGYLEGIRGALTTEEMDSILFGGEIMTLIMGLRFLTDHLEGNVYYRVSYPLQNLHRAKNQLTLLQSQQAHRTRFAQFAAQL